MRATFLSRAEQFSRWGNVQRTHRHCTIRLPGKFVQHRLSPRRATAHWRSQAVNNAVSVHAADGSAVKVACLVEHHAGLGILPIPGGAKVVESCQRLGKASGSTEKN